MPTRTRKNDKVHTLTISNGPAKLKIEVVEAINEPGYAIGTINILQTHFHVECVEVEADGADKVAIDSAYQSRIDSYYDEFESDFEMVSFDKRQWFVSVTPHGT